MFREKLIPANSAVSLTNDPELQSDDLESEQGALQMKIFLDYCYFIEKLWLDWKQYSLRFFTLSDQPNYNQN